LKGVIGRLRRFLPVLPTTLRILKWVLPTTLRVYGLRPSGKTKGSVYGLRQSGRTKGTYQLLKDTNQRR